jgi:hypothetical protein
MSRLGLPTTGYDVTDGRDGPRQRRRTGDIFGRGFCVAANRLQAQKAGAASDR